MLLLVVFTSLLIPCASLKIAIFSSAMSNSQLIYTTRLAETLLKGGHDVTTITTSIFTEFDYTRVKMNKRIKDYFVDGAIGMSQSESNEILSLSVFEDLPMWHPHVSKEYEMWTEVMAGSCRKMLLNKEFLRWIENEKFDIAFTHICNLCPIGIIHMAKIPSWIWYSSGMMVEYVAWSIGAPIVPSYVPPVLMDSYDTMNFIERTKSVIGHGLFKLIWPRLIVTVEQAMFEELVDPNFPSLIDLAKKCPLVTLNTNDLYDFPRPTLAKVIPIGGLGVQFKDAKPLTGEFAKVYSLGKPVIVVSFGSITPIHLMPQEWKTALMGAFANFLEYQFIMRYPEDDLKKIQPSNVLISKWLPQSDLLLNNLTKAIISHGGYNSLQEAITAGTPLITIALFADQPKNAKLASKHGIAVNLEKRQMNKDNIIGAIKEVTENTRYRDNVKRLQKMLKMQPVKPEDLLLKWTEFVAEFKTLENLEPAGQHLNFMQYHSIDVYLFLVSFVLFTLMLFAYVVRFMFRILSSVVSLKKLKTL